MRSLSAGQVLEGRFRLLEPVGEGGAGRIWRAQRLADGELRALKLPATAADTGRLRVEFEQNRRLRHPAVLHIEELVADDAGAPLCLVMPWLSGGHIGALRGAGWRALLRALLPLTEALEYAHRQGVVHRDLKPSNILATGEGGFLLADFGCGGEGGGGGSLPGMSPQQLAGESPAIGDDIYGFGALLYELLAGAPLFHPDVSPERIRTGIPVVPAQDLTGEPLPDRLRQLVTAMLQKSVAARPPGMSAVRDAFEEILREPAVGMPSRPAGVAASALGEADRPLPLLPPGPLLPKRDGLPAIWVGWALAMLILLAVVVFFYLPTLAPPPGGEPSSASSNAPLPNSSATASVPAAPAPVSQDLLDEALGAWLQQEESLRPLNPARWAGEAWSELQRTAQSADAAYRSGDREAAFTAWLQATQQAKTLVEAAPARRAEALRAGEAALAAGDQPQAIAQFEIALTLAPTDAVATRGLQRARQLDRVRALMQQAGAAEATGARADAIALYRDVLRLDRDWTAARQALTRLEQASATENHEARMAEGYAAQASARHAAARTAFERALALRPGDARAAAALAQARTDEQAERMRELQSQARALEGAERWAEALARYEQALTLDAGLAESKEGAARARDRLELERRMQRELGRADRFNDDAMWTAAQSVLTEARAIAEPAEPAGPGARLRGQIDELDRLLQIARTEVAVTLESDALTEVTVYRVGRLGAFASRTLNLRPGAYTAVGSRPGYRDVRRDFRVVPGGSDPVIVRCEEAI